ncbi:MAG: 2,4-dihydroxyhept-2-ene-1,7-dioic acid aldolase [Flavobacteriaceae bacterium]|nr:2,4-dihydroxyhept-2-ene-1,7-dioic acid aldolase [Flavobacteriaceae bacterium]|tara:strand:- start:13 stop:753 length:741 start_codon:yes stop_codon:yes gene_type:complete
MKKNTTIGSWITLNHTSIVEIIAEAGFDWLCVDLEHSVTDYKEAQQLISSIQSKGIIAYVRVGENNPLIIKRILDAGADGIIIPNINSKNEALKAVESIYYPPIGKRGVGLARAQKYGFDFNKYRDGKAKNIKIIVQIEHINAINELESILEIDEIDGTFIGPYDLSGSMGKPGQYDDIDVKEVLSKYETIVKNYDKLIGYHVIEPDHTKVIDKINKGYNFIAFSLDTIFLGSAVRNEMKSLKNNL